MFTFKKSNKKKLLICGDSFAADWSPINPDALTEGWPGLMSNHYEVTNLAENGVCEYKVLQQLKSVNLKKFDALIVNHVSSNRIYVKRHPIHYNDPFRKNTDLMYADIKEHLNEYPGLQPIVDYFENYYDMDYSNYVHNLICNEIDEYLKNYSNLKILHVVYRDDADHYQFKDYLSFFNIFLKYRGNINHYTPEGNQIIYNKIKEYFSLQ